MQLNKIWVPIPIKQKEVIWGYIPIIKAPFTKRDLIFFALGIPIAVPVYFVYSFLFPPNGIVDYLTMFITLLFIPIMTTLISHKKLNGNYIENAILQKLKHQMGSSVSLNEKALKRINSKEVK